MTSAPTTLKSCLGLGAVVALVVGDTLGSGVFFTPGELAAVAHHHWQVYFIWALAGFITLCGALTLGELCSLRPRAGASYHFIREGFGPFWAFLLVWINLWVGGPGSVAGLAASLGAFLKSSFGIPPPFTPVAMGSAAIAILVLVNLAGVQWGGRTQIALTVLKVAGIAAIVVGGLWLAAPALPPEALAAPPMPGQTISEASGVGGLIRFTGLGIAVVLFAYDGWIDVSHVAGEVRRPERTVPKGLALGVVALTLLYLVVNLAFLRSVPIEAMRQAPAAVASKVLTAAYGPSYGTLLNALVVISMFGAMGGLVMTLPRLYYTMAAEYGGQGRGAPQIFFRALGRVSSRSAVPSGAILFTGVASIVALMFFGSFSKLAGDGEALAYIARRPNMTYTRDLACVFSSGAVLMGPHLIGRRGDQWMLGRAFERLGIRMLGSIAQPGFLEGGGVTLLGTDTVVASICDRANEAGTAQLRQLTTGGDLRFFLEVPLPPGHIHIDGLFMVLDEDLCLIHEETPARLPCRLYEAGKSAPRPVLFGDYLTERKVRRIAITEQERLEGQLNLVVVKRGRLAVGFGEAGRLRSELARFGWTIENHPSTELAAGKGGAHCMTCPLLVG